MLAIEISRHGGVEVLEPVERREPRRSAGEVLVRNRWIGVNYVDLQHRDGQPYPIELPLIPGTEAAGEIVGADDPALVGCPAVHFGHLAGVYAEYTAVPLEHVVALERGAPLDVAAAIAMSGTTAYVLTHMATRVGPGDRVVVHAAAGATGGAIVQLAAAAGAEVIALASTEEKAAAARALGARHAFTTPEAVLEVTGGRGANIVYDGGGRDTFEASLDMLATRGTLVLYGQSSGPVEPFDPARLSGLTGRSAGSLTLRWAAASHYLATRQARAAAIAFVLSRLDPRIAGRFALRDAAQAHALLAGRTVAGKLLLRA